MFLGFSFDYFRDLYELLDSPVLQGDDPDCAFFAWEKFGEEFYNVQSVFDMPEARISFAENFNTSNGNFHSQNNEGEVIKEIIPKCLFFLYNDSKKFLKIVCILNAFDLFSE